VEFLDKSQTDPMKSVNTYNKELSLAW